MRTYQTQHLTVECYNEAVWLQERNIIRVTGNAPVTQVQLKIGHQTAPVSATYTLDGDGRVEIDATDVLRLSIENGIGGNVNSIYIVDPTNGEYVNIYGKIAGLINPDGVLVPDNVNRLRVVEYTEAFNTRVVIVPPQRMLMDLGTNDTRITCEFYPSQAETGLSYYFGLQEEYEHGQPVVERSVVVDQGAVKIRTWTDEAPGIGTATIQIVHLHPLEGCKQYAAVRWVSFTGVTRLHTWEVSKQKNETSGAFELLTQDGTFNVAKGRKDGFALRLDGLNAYDYWYYADVCHSSRVEVSLDGQTWQRVNVTTKGVTVPDGNAGRLNTLEVELTYKEYDAISL